MTIDQRYIQVSLKLEILSCIWLSKAQNGLDIVEHNIFIYTRPNQVLSTY